MIKPSILILAATFIAMPALAQPADPAAAPAAAETAAPAAAPETAAPAAPAALPKCSAKVQDACQQTSAQESRAISAAEADRRGKHADAPGAVAATPAADTMATDGMTAAKPMSHKRMHRKHHKGHAMTKVKTMTQTTSEAAPAK